ncbi:MAG: hypothetical protein LAP85_29230 [Acidobacteriia bacterium]|nr:hypothetical protein [Terriglobia bacterium]
MELKDAGNLGRTFLANHGLLDCNLVFFNLPQPQGFACRNTIGLSMDYVLMNDWNAIADTLLHEIGHVLAPDDHEHGFAWQAECKRIDALHEKTLDRGFIHLSDLFQKDFALNAAGDRYLNKIRDVVNQRASWGVKGDVDFTTFAHPPAVSDKFLYYDDYTYGLRQTF